MLALLLLVQKFSSSRVSEFGGELNVGGYIYIFIKLVDKSIIIAVLKDILIGSIH